MDITPKSRRRLVTKVDLTAMVDLGFLLITFFMLASSFHKPKTMEILKPDENGHFEYPESKTAILLIGTREKVYHYSLPETFSYDEIQIDSFSLTNNSLRAFIQKRQDEVAMQWGDKEKLFVVIKTLQSASVKSVVDVLDEMLINDVGHYALVKPDTPLDSFVINVISENH